VSEPFAADLSVGLFGLHREGPVSVREHVSQVPEYAAFDIGSVTLLCLEPPVH